MIIRHIKMAKLKKHLIANRHVLNRKKHKNAKFLLRDNKKCTEPKRNHMKNSELAKYIIKKDEYCSIKNPKLHTIVDQFENEKYEYKINMNSCGKEKICQTIIAMANCLGGRIYFGISDSRVVFGVHNNCNWDKYMLEIAGSLKYHSEPNIPLVRSHHKLLNKSYKLYWIEVLPSSDRDYKYKGKKFVRCLSSNQNVQTDYTYDDLLSEIKKLKKRIASKQRVIKDLEEELNIKDNYIKNLVKNFYNNIK